MPEYVAVFRFDSQPRQTRKWEWRERSECGSYVFISETHFYIALHGRSRYIRPCILWGNPLLWNTQKNFTWNVGMVITLAGGLLVFNVVRLSISDILFAAGISWDVAHNLISGISYFAVWMLIWRCNLAGMVNVSD